MASPPSLHCVDFAALIDKHTDEEINIEQHFTPEELGELCEYEKVRFRNLKRNYLMLIELGIAAKMPDFMMKSRRPFKRHFTESDSDDEWIPSVETKVYKTKGPTRKSWQPPSRKSGRNFTKPPENLQNQKIVAKETKIKERKKRQKISVKESPHPKSSQLVDLTDVLRECFAESDDENEEVFEGFSLREIEDSERWSKERIERNNTLIYQIENDIIVLEVEEEEEEEDVPQNGGDAGDDNNPRVVDEQSAPETSKKRYPRRSVARVNYEEQRVPKDDDYIFCDDCDREHEGDCPIHGPLIAIEDTKVPNDGSDAQRAVHSLPKGLVVRPSKIPGAGDGVWTEMDIAKGLRFGPYEGIEVVDSKAAHQSGYCWLIYHDGDIISHYVDAQYHRFANWLRFVNCARNEQEQNLLAYQYQGNIYYKTIKPVMKGSELLVWYGDEYAKELGITEEKSEIHALFRNAGFEVWECDVCEKIFPSEWWLLGHRRHHGDRTGSKRYKCDQCSYSTDNSSVLTDHRRTHTNERPFSCQTCGKAFTLACNLRMHEKIHTGQRDHCCTVCGYRCTHAGTLKIHMRTHTGEKPYRCEVCGYRCTQAGSLKTHMRTHTGEKPYRCEVCGYRCTMAGTLKTHMRTHTGEKPYKCEVCGYRFTMAGSLKTHMRTHMKEKLNSLNMNDSRKTQAGVISNVYCCSLCDKRFSTADFLHQHIQSHRDE